jgi:hypothetical protein
MPLNLYVYILQEPDEIQLGTEWTYTQEGERRIYQRKPKFAYYVPVLKSLQVHIGNHFLICLDHLVQTVALLLWWEWFLIVMDDTRIFNLIII